MIATLFLLAYLAGGTLTLLGALCSAGRALYRSVSDLWLRGRMAASPDRAEASAGEAEAYADARVAEAEPYFDRAAAQRELLAVSREGFRRLQEEPKLPIWEACFEHTGPFLIYEN